MPPADAAEDVLAEKAAVASTWPWVPPKLYIFKKSFINGMNFAHVAQGGHTSVPAMDWAEMGALGEG